MKKTPAPFPFEGEGEVYFSTRQGFGNQHSQERRQQQLASHCALSPLSWQNPQIQKEVFAVGSLVGSLEPSGGRQSLSFRSQVRCYTSGTWRKGRGTQPSMQIHPTVLPPFAHGFVLIFPRGYAGFRNGLLPSSTPRGPSRFLHYFLHTRPVWSIPSQSLWFL